MGQHLGGVFMIVTALQRQAHDLDSDSLYAGIKRPLTLEAPEILPISSAMTSSTVPPLHSNSFTWTTCC